MAAVDAPYPLPHIFRKAGSFLHVSEKKSSALSLARTFGRLFNVNVNEGRREYNCVYHDLSCSIAVDGEVITSQMTFVSLDGRIIDNSFPGNWKTESNLSTLFFCPLERVPAKGKKLTCRLLKEFAATSTSVFLWLDCDSEGEAIASDVIAVCESQFPRPRSPIIYKRPRPSSLDIRDIYRALENLSPHDQNCVLNLKQIGAVKARHEIDFRVGCAFTRLQSNHLSRTFQIPDVKEMDYTLKFGLCTFPTLYYILENLLHPRRAWTLVFSDGRNSFNYREEIPTEANAIRLLNRLGYSTAKVEKINRITISHGPPLPLNTYDMLIRAAKDLRLGSTKTMTVAQELFQEGYISYPRTDAVVFTLNFDLKKIVEKYANHEHWGPYASKLLNDDTLWKEPGRGWNVHEPIHPINPYGFSGHGPETNWDSAKLFAGSLRIYC